MKWLKNAKKENQKGMSKGTVFFFSRKKFMFYTFLEKIDWLNEKAVFFFFQRQKKKNTDLRSNEWMTFWTFTGKKKHKKKNTVLKEKKMALDQLLQKKKKITQFVFFFPDSGKKKYTILGFDWLNGQRTFSGKKNTVPLT